MFDVSFSELLLIGIVALVVIGPQRLPTVARTIGHLVGRAQRYVNDVKSDIQREMDLDELRNLKGQMEDAARTVQSSLEETTQELQQAKESLVDTAHSTVQSMRAELQAPHGEPEHKPDETAVPSVPDPQKSLPGFAEASALAEEPHPQPPPSSSNGTPT